MAEKDWQEDYITLHSEEIPVKIGWLPQAALQFFPENPRLYSILSAFDEIPSQSEIEEILLARDHVRQLIQSIRANGGLTDPIFVQDKKYIVLEGNSRLAAYRELARQDAIKWGKIKCKVLPRDIEEDKIFALLGEYHIIGKQDWAPYEQAGYLYRRCKNYGTDEHKLAIDLGLSIKKVNHLIAVYCFMIDHKDNDPSRWSYYDEYLKSQKIKKVRIEHPEFDKLIVSKIKSGEIPRAVDVRDDLKKILLAGNKLIHSFISGKKTFKKCVEQAENGGVDEHCYQGVKKFRNWLVEHRDEIKEMPPPIAHKMLFEIRKIKKGFDNLERYLQH